jgi:hypothetical protein
MNVHSSALTAGHLAKVARKTPLDSADIRTKPQFGLVSHFNMNVSRFSWSHTVPELSELDVGESSTLEHK